jgi:hypothetical protein
MATDLARGEEDPAIARIDVSGGVGGTSPRGVAVVAMTLTAR